MHLAFWHGYLLADTGSNIFTRELVKACARLGHDVTLFCQDPDAASRIGDAAEIVRPPIGRHLPVFVEDPYPDLEAVHVARFDEDDLRRYVAVNGEAIRRCNERRTVDFLVANHAIMGGPVAHEGCAVSDTPFGVYVHGSELEYAIRGRPHLGRMARSALDAAAIVFVGSRHIERVTTELLGPGPYTERVELLPPGVDLTGFHPERGSLEALARLLDEDALLRGPERAERSPDADASERLRDIGRFVLYAGKLMSEKGAGLLVDAWRAIDRKHPDVHLVMVGFGPDRAALQERARGVRAVFTGAMSHEQLQLLMPLADVVVVPSVVPEAFGMIAAEAAASGVVPLVARHSGLAEVAEALGEAAFSFDGAGEALTGELERVLNLSQAERRRLGARARSRAQELWGWESVAQRLVDVAGA